MFSTQFVDGYTENWIPIKSGKPPDAVEIQHLLSKSEVLGLGVFGKEVNQHKLFV